MTSRLMMESEEKKEEIPTRCEERLDRVADCVEDTGQCFEGIGYLIHDCINKNKKHHKNIKCEEKEGQIVSNKT